MALMTVSIEPSRIRDSSPARSIDDVRSAGAGTRALLVERFDPPGLRLGMPEGPLEADGRKRCGKVVRSAASSLAVESASRTRPEQDDGVGPGPYTLRGCAPTTVGDWGIAALRPSPTP